MATAYVSFAAVGARANTGGTVDIMAQPYRSETVATSGVSAAGALVAGAGEVAQVWCDVAVYVTAGATPVAAMASALFVPAGSLAYVPLALGDKIAIIDA